MQWSDWFYRNTHQQMPRKWPYKLNLLVPLSSRSFEGMGFDLILLISILEPKGHKKGKKWPKLKWFNIDIRKGFIFVFIFILPADLGPFGFKKYLSAWFLRNVYNTYVSWNAIKTTQPPRKTNYLSDGKVTTRSGWCCRSFKFQAVQVIR